MAIATQIIGVSWWKVTLPILLGDLVGAVVGIAIYHMWNVGRAKEEG